MNEVLVKGKGSLPLYRQLENILKDRILSGEFKDGDLFPCERELIEAYGVSRITVRQALSNLSEAGMVEAYPGIGTTVVLGRINETLKGVKSFSEEMREHGVEMSTSYSLCSLILPPEEAMVKLSLKRGEKCFYLERVRCVSSSPIVYSHTYISEKWGLEIDDTLYSSSLYSYLKEKKGIVISGAKDSFEARLADRETAEQLSIKPGDPVLKRTRLSYVNGKDIFEYTSCYYRADKYKYTVEL